MALKIDVKDRIATYPGRVKLTPVAGSENTYDMVREDSPIEGGTPINKALFDNKAYTLTDNTTVYVSKSGNDLNGDGSYDSPYATIQKAIDSIPLHLGGHTVTIDIGAGTYEERLVVNGFSSGKLVIGVYGRSTTIRGIDIDNSSLVEINIPYITYATGFEGNLFDVDNGSNVLISQGVTIDGDNKSGLVGCLSARNNSTVSASSGNSVTVKNCFSGIDASWGARISLARLYGQGLYMGLTIGTGAILSYDTSTLTSDVGDDISSGGRVFSGSGTVNFVTATIE